MANAQLLVQHTLIKMALNALIVILLVILVTVLVLIAVLVAFKEIIMICNYIVVLRSVLLVNTQIQLLKHANTAILVVILVQDRLQPNVLHVQLHHIYILDNVFLAVLKDISLIIQIILALVNIFKFLF